MGCSAELTADSFFSSKYVLSHFRITKYCAMIRASYTPCHFEECLRSRLLFTQHDISYSMNHSFQATSCFSYKRPLCCHSNPLTGSGDCCPGADEGAVTEWERQRQRGRAGGSQSPDSNERSAAEMYYRSGAIHKRFAVHVGCMCTHFYSHTCTCRQKGTYSFCRVT